ncbi:MAG: TspO/MBR family protein [Anaerolineae bacterium]
MVFNRDTLRQFINIFGFVLTVVINTISQTLPFNNQTNAEIANRFPIFFLPANFTFSIWGVIYLGLLAFTVYQALPSQRENPVLRRIGYWFFLTCLMNCAWIFAFQYDLYTVSMLPMVVLLVSLIAIHLKLNIGKERVSTAAHWCVHVPMSIYLGWISVATIANASYVLYVDFAWRDPASGQLATFGMLLIGAALAGLMLFIRNTPAFAFVVIWAFMGIFARHNAAPTFTTTLPTDFVTLAAATGTFAAVMSAAIAVTAAAWFLVKGRKSV